MGHHHGFNFGLDAFGYDVNAESAAQRDHRLDDPS
jgi:hypothetical protein